MINRILYAKPQNTAIRINDNMDRSISAALEKCFRLFAYTVSAAEKPVRDFRDQTPLILEKIIDDFHRYKLWAGHVRASHSGTRHQGSLDYHFEKGSFYEAQVGVLRQILITFPQFPPCSQFCVPDLMPQSLDLWLMLSIPSLPAQKLFENRP